MNLYVEGGGSRAPLKKGCRQGFQRFLEKAGLRGKMPRIIACGSREKVYEDYSDALQRGKPAAMIVDSEGPVSASHQSGCPAGWQPWGHLKQRDNWSKPPTAPDTDCHLMVQFMESWFLADPQALKDRFGQGFQQNKLPATGTGKGQPLEDIPKEDVINGLKEATRNCSAGPYAKGKLSFELLGALDPNKVASQSPWAKRFIETLKDKMGV